MTTRMNHLGSETLRTFWILIAAGFLHSVAGRKITDEIAPGDYLQYRSGDIILGAAVEVHRHSSDAECGELRGKGVQDVELINMIVEQINRNQSLLPGINLGTVMIDSCAWPPHALKRIVTDILPLVTSSGTCHNGSELLTNSTPVFAGLIGEGTSKVSMQMAYLLQGYAIPQISHWATHHDLSNKDNYPYFFRTISPDSFQTRAIVTLVKQMEWNYVSVVYEEDCLGRDFFISFSKYANQHDICIEQAESIPGNDDSDDIYLNVARKLRDSSAKAKVVIVFTKTTPAEKLIMATHSLAPEDNSLIWLGSDSWVGSLPKSTSNMSYMHSLDGAIGFKPKGGSIEGFNERMTNFTLQNMDKRDSALNPWMKDYIAQENECSLPKHDNDHELNICNPDSSLGRNFQGYSLLQNLANAVLAFAHALDMYQKEKCGSSGMCDRIGKMKGTNKLAAAIYPFLKNVSFVGINGDYFAFDERQDGPPFYDVITFRKRDILNTSKGWVTIGTYKSEEIMWNDEAPKGPIKARMTKSVCSEPCADGQEKIQDTEKCCFHCVPCKLNQFVSNSNKCEDCPGKMIPNKARNGCYPLTIQEMHFRRIQYLIPFCLSILFITVALVVGAIFVKHRDTAIVKASGKELSMFVLFGVFLTFFNSFTIGSQTDYSCIIPRFTLAVGPTCMYAGLLVKTIRVVIIFRSKKALSKEMKTFLRPLSQVLVTIGVVLVQVIVLIVWLMLFPAEASVETNIESKTAFRTCRCMTRACVFVGIVYPVILIIACTVVATINRKVPTGFNETSYIGFTMYTTCVIWLAFPPIFLSSSDNIPQKLMTTSICLDISALTVLGCLFVPRCYTILVHPHENNQQAVMSQARYWTKPDTASIVLLANNHKSSDPTSVNEA